MKFNTKKFISGFLAVVMLASSFPNLTVNATEENPFTEEEISSSEDSTIKTPFTDDNDENPFINDGNIETPSTDDGNTEIPSTDDGNTETPSTDDGNTETPATDDTNIETPSTDDTNSETPATDDGNTETPATDDGTAENPPADNDGEETPSVDDDTADEPSDEDDTSDTTEDDSAITAIGNPDAYQYVAFPAYDDNVIFTVPDKAGIVLLEQAAPPSKLYRVDSSIIDDFEFEAAVRSDYRLEVPEELKDILTEKGSRRMQKGKWVYKYSLTLSELSTTPDEPVSIQLTQIQEAVQIEITGEAITSGIDENGMALVGSEVSIEVTQPGYALALHTKDKNGNDVYTAMALDYDNQYTFIAEKAVDFVVVDPEQTAYVVAYADSRRAKLTGVAGLKLNSLASSAQGYNEIVLNFTAVKNGSDGTENEKAYYEVKVTAIPKTGATAPAGSSTEPQYYYIPKTADINTQSKSIKVNNGVAPTACTYEFSTRLVLINKNTAVPSADKASASAIEAALSGNTLTKRFSTKELYYEDNLKFTKKKTKIYTGEQNVLAGMVKYSKKASYLHDLTAVAYDSHGAVCSGIKCTIKNDNDELYISANSNVEPGKYNVVVYSGIGESKNTSGSPQGGTMYQSNTSFTLTLEPAIDYIYTEDITKQAAVSSKDITFKAVPVGYSYWTGTKTKSQKFTYEIKSAVPTSSNTYNVTAPTEKVMSNVSVNAKGIVTIKKGYSVEADTKKNYIAVVIKAADYEGNTTTATACVQIVSEALVPTNIYLVDSNGNKLGTKLTADKADYAQVIVEDQNGNKMNDHVTITPTDNAKHTTGICVYKDPYNNYADTLFIRKCGSVNIKAVSKDGSKKSKTVKFTISLPSFSRVSLSDTSISDGFMWTELTGNNGSFSYSAPRGSSIRLKIGAVPSLLNPISYPKRGWYDWAYTITSGKLTFDGDYWIITPTAEDAKLVIWRKSNPFRRWQATFTNTNWKTVPANAPKISLADGKIYSNKYSNITDVTGNKVPNQKLTYKYASGDYDSLKLIKVTNNAPDVSVSNFNATSKTFTLEMSPGDDIKCGSYKYKIAFCKSGVIQCKPTIITIKVNKTPAIKFTSAYTLKTTDSSVALKCTPKEFIPDCNATLLNGNTNGKANDFSKYFELDTNQQTGQKQVVIKWKSSVTDAEKKELKGKSLTGYVKYSYYCGKSKVEGATAKIKITVR